MFGTRVAILVGHRGVLGWAPGAEGRFRGLYCAKPPPWIGWHILTNKQESEKLESMARKKRGANDYKNNLTDW